MAHKTWTVSWLQGFCFSLCQKQLYFNFHFPHDCSNHQPENDELLDTARMKAVQLAFSIHTCGFHYQSYNIALGYAAHHSCRIAFLRVSTIAVWYRSSASHGTQNPSNRAKPNQLLTKFILIFFDIHPFFIFIYVLVPKHMKVQGIAVFSCLYLSWFCILGSILSLKFLILRGRKENAILNLLSTCFLLQAHQ